MVYLYQLIQLAKATCSSMPTECVVPSAEVSDMPPSFSTPPRALTASKNFLPWSISCFRLLNNCATTNDKPVFSVCQFYCARYSYRLDVYPSVRPSVRLSITRWYCVETAQPIVKLSSLPGIAA